MKRLIVSEVTFYDDDRLLFYTYIGEEDGRKTLIASAWGNTMSQSRDRANKLCNLLNNEYEKNDSVPFSPS